LLTPGLCRGLLLFTGPVPQNVNGKHNRFQDTDTHKDSVLYDGNILVAIDDGGRVAVLQRDLVGAVGIVVAPIGNWDLGAGGGVVVCIVGFVDDGGVVLNLFYIGPRRAGLNRPLAKLSKAVKVANTSD